MKKDRHARLIINVTISQDVMVELFSCETSHEMWVKLADMFSQKSENEIDNLYRKL